MSSSANSFTCCLNPFPQNSRTHSKTRKTSRIFCISSSKSAKSENSRNRRTIQLRTDARLVANGSVRADGVLDEIGTLLYSIDFTTPEECTRTYALIFQKCRKLDGLNLGFQVHAHLIVCGVDLCAYLGSQVIELYAKHLCVNEARKVFEKMPERNVFSWTSMMEMYNEIGDYEETINLFYMMIEEGIRPDHFIFPKVFKGCSELKDYRVGKNVYEYMLSIGFEGNACVNRSFLDMLVKCGKMNVAAQFFKDLEFKDVYMWNMMVSGYSLEGNSKEALKCVEEMKMEGLTPDRVTLNSIITGYARNGKVSEAFQYFTEVIDSSIDLKPNVVTWTALITGYEQNGYFSEALNVFQLMVNYGIKPTSITIAGSVSACKNLSLLRRGKEIHCYCIKTVELDSDLLVRNSLLDFYAKCHSLDTAGKVFDRIKSKDLISWNSLIAGYASRGCLNKAVQLLNKMLLEGIEPDLVTWNCLITGCTQSGDGELAIEMFNKMFETGLDPNSTTISGVLAGCSQGKDLKLGKEIHGYVIRNYFELSTGVGSALISMYSACGFPELAISVFQGLSAKDVVIWNSIIASCTQNGLPTEGLRCLRDMKLDNVEPDTVTMVSVLPACSKLAAQRQGKEIHQFVIRNGLYTSNFVMNALVDMYGRCGSIKSSKILFDSMSSKDLATWNVMISVYGMHGSGVDAITVFHELRSKGLKPNHVTFTNLLSACSHSGLVDEGWVLFEMIKKEYELEPAIEQYCCMVDLMARAGQFEQAINFIDSMHIEPNSAVWGSLMGACRIHRNPTVAEYAAKHLFELEPQVSGHYILLANIYAAAERWDDAARIRCLMRERGVTKRSPGCSWIEVKRKVHSFIIGDPSNPSMEEISEKLKSLFGEIKKVGYIADTNYVLQKVKEEEKEQSLCGHSEKLALAFGLINTSAGTPLRIIKNLRICGDCHLAAKCISKVEKREIIMRDNYRFHHFVDGVCSCRDYW